MEAGDSHHPEGLCGRREEKGVQEGNRQGLAPSHFAQFGLFLSRVRVASFPSDTLVHQAFVTLNVAKTGAPLLRPARACVPPSPARHQPLVVPIRLKAEASCHCARLGPRTQPRSPSPPWASVTRHAHSGALHRQRREQLSPGPALP